jgi:hypothetical protein
MIKLKWVLLSLVAFLGLVSAQQTATIMLQDAGFLSIKG